MPNADFTGCWDQALANGSDIDHYSFTTGTVVGSTVKIDVSSFSSNEDLYTVSAVDKNGTVVQKVLLMSKLMLVLHKNKH